MADESMMQGERFAVVPEWLLDEPSVSDRAVRLYGVLRRYVGTNGVAWPSRRKIAERLACSMDTIDRAVAELVAAGALRVERRHRDDGSLTSSSYSLWPFSRGEVAADLRRGAAAPKRHHERESVRTRVSESPRTSATSRVDEAPQLVEISSEPERLAHLMVALLGENGCRVRGSARGGPPERWLLAFDRLLRLDERPVDEVERVLRWTMADEFEQAVVLSPDKFRARYDSLRLKAARRAGQHASDVGDTVAQIRALIRSNGRTRRPTDVSPEARVVIDAVGWGRLCSMDERDLDRAIAASLTARAS